MDQMCRPFPFDIVRKAFKVTIAFKNFMPNKIRFFVFITKGKVVTCIDHQRKITPILFIPKQQILNIMT